MYESQPVEPVDPSPESSDSGGGRSIWVYVLIGLLIVLLLAIIGALFLAASGPSAPPPTEDEVWNRIQESGIIRAGTSGDYPPFEYYDENVKLVGFDVALMGEVARELNLQLDLSDYAFEGLPQAMQVGQIDAAIAALSVTEQREEVIDFSNVYYIGEDAILAQAGADIGPITGVAQMAEYRIGVQKLTVYDDFVQSALVDTGLMPADQLFAYAKPEHAVNDLVQGRLDLVMLDKEPANVAVSEAEVKIVGSNLSQQRFAIALPQGAFILRQNVNDALTRLQNSGVINELANEWLGLEPEEILPVPTATPGPTATPQPTVTPSACLNDMDFVDDLNLDDNNLSDYPVVEGGEPFRKGWRIRNTGTCTWDDGYFIDYVRGARMSGEPTPIVGTVAPGQTYDMWVDFVAPDDPGQYVGFWQMFSDGNVAFGQTIWVAVQVLDDTGATATPQPTATATATIPPEPTDTDEPQPTDTEEPGPTATPTQPVEAILDITWEWVDLMEENPPSQSVIPDTETEKYTLFFKDDGTVDVVADCNSAQGTYTANGFDLTIELGPFTQVECDPGSLYAQYLMLIQEVEMFAQPQSDRLELIKEDDWTMGLKDGS